jgi:hypothetical protein
MSRAGRVPRLVEPEEMVPPLLWVVSQAADNVNGYRFDANLWDRHCRPPKPPAAPAARPASRCTRNRLEEARRGHSSGKPARRRPTFSVFSHNAQILL